jgi:hypothetical protein
MSILEELDAHEELFLLSISEPEDNVLVLVVSEAGVIHDASGEVAGPTSAYHLVSAFEGAARYQLVFESYVAYSVRNESFTIRDDDEKWTGRLFCTYERSKFLDFVREGTIASEEHPGPITHYGINCANHIVDVAAVTVPQVQRIPASKVG